MDLNDVLKKSNTAYLGAMDNLQAMRGSINLLSNQLMQAHSKIDQLTKELEDGKSKKK